MFKEKGKGIASFISELLFVTVLAMALLWLIFSCGGCSADTHSTAKHALKEALVIGQEIENIERVKCASTVCPNADRIAAYLKAGQAIYDANSIDGNCPMLLATVDIARSWVSTEYPDKPEYRVMLAILRSELDGLCGDGD